jgi:OTU-like cysteine protease
MQSDGHCLYRAVEDQLAITDGPAGPSFWELRSLAASYMRLHAAETIPFLTQVCPSHVHPFSQACPFHLAGHLS